jgi:Tfp pilus assembly protein PilX
MKIIGKRDDETGIALITSLIVLMAITIISAAIIFQATTQYKISRRNKAEIVAMNLAEAGVEYAIWQLETDSTFSGTGSVTVGEGTYSCTITDITGFPNEKLITAIGEAAGYPASRAVMVRVGISYSSSANWQGNSPFGYAAFGKDKVTNMGFTGNTVFDAYNSDSGTYAATKGDSGDVRSNAGIDLGGNTIVKGDAVAGPSNTVTLSSNAEVTGDSAKAETYAALIDIPSAETSKCTTALSISSNTVVNLGKVGETITYYYTSISIAGNAKINIPAGANVIFYVSGNVSIAGNGIVNNNLNNDATAVQMFVAGSSANFSGNANYTGVVYAPNGTIKFSGNGSGYGSFIGNKVTVSGNGNVHYDLATQNINVPFWSTPEVGVAGGVQKIYSWQRR